MADETDEQRAKREEREQARALREKQARSDECGRMLERLLREAGRRYMDCTVQSFKCDCTPQHMAVATLNGYIANLPSHLAQGDGLILYGPVGTGKDHLMMAAAREAVMRGASLQWITGLDLFAWLRDTISRDESSETVFKMAIEPQVLCLSDPLPPVVGGSDRSQGSLTDYQAQSLLRIVDRRYRDRKCTWATVNVADGKEFAQRIGAPVFDRLRDGAVTVACDWTSYRKAQ